MRRIWTGGGGAGMSGHHGRTGDPMLFDFETLAPQGLRDDRVLTPGRCHIGTPKPNLIGRLHGAGWYARTTDRFEVPRIPAADRRRRS